MLNSLYIILIIQGKLLKRMLNYPLICMGIILFKLVSEERLYDNAEFFFKMRFTIKSKKYEQRKNPIHQRNFNE